jgi:hypothetical protein
MRSYTRLASCKRMDMYANETYHGVPGTSAQTKRIVAYTETADTVVVPLQCADTLATKNVPNLQLR